jgi:hypothetical protein
MPQFNHALLKELSERDGATIIKEYDSLNMASRIAFTCRCGSSDVKRFGAFIYPSNSGIFCKACVKKVGYEKRKQTNLEKYGVEHPYQLEIFKEKYKESMLKKYGVTNPQQSTEIKEKTKQTCQIKYGTSCPLKSSMVKEKIATTNIEKYGSANVFAAKAIKEKITKTNIEKYGVFNAMQSAQCQAKLEATSLQKYGTRRPSESKVVRDKIQHAHITKTDEEQTEINNKREETCVEKYGTTSTNKLESIKEQKRQTCLKKYGVENHMQSKEVQAKLQNRGYKRKEYTMPSGDIRIVQGFEPYALTDLLKLYSEEQIKTKREDIPDIIYTANDKTRHYFPDIYIPHCNTIIEVKSTWTYKCTTDNVKEKGDACKAAGYNYEVWVYNGKGQRVTAPP